MHAGYWHNLCMASVRCVCMHCVRLPPAASCAYGAGGVGEAVAEVLGDGAVLAGRSVLNTYGCLRRRRALVG